MTPELTVLPDPIIAHVSSDESPLADLATRLTAQVASRGQDQAMAMIELRFADGPGVFPALVKGSIRERIFVEPTGRCYFTSNFNGLTRPRQEPGRVRAEGSLLDMLIHAVRHAGYLDKSGKPAPVTKEATP